MYKMGPPTSVLALRAPTGDSIRADLKTNTGDQIDQVVIEGLDAEFSKESYTPEDATLRIQAVYTEADGKQDLVSGELELIQDVGAGEIRATFNGLQNNDPFTLEATATPRTDGRLKIVVVRTFKNGLPRTTGQGEQRPGTRWGIFTEPRESAPRRTGEYKYAEKIESREATITGDYEDGTSFQDIVDLGNIFAILAFGGLFEDQSEEAKLAAKVALMIWIISALNDEVV